MLSNKRNAVTKLINKKALYNNFWSKKLLFLKSIGIRLSAKKNTERR